MKKKIISFAAAFALTASLVSAYCPVKTDSGSNQLTAAAADSGVVANPVIWSDVPDCDVICVGDTYYMVSTTMYFCPGVPIMKSKDMMSWEICNYVYDTYANGDKQNLVGGQHDYAHGQWATSLRYNDGWYYVFFGSYGTGNSYIYKTRDIENGTWTRTEIRGMYHDASMLFDTDGRKYLIYGSGEIKIKEFNDDMTGFKSGGLDKTLFKTGLSGLAGEGSRAVKIGDYYYVFIIAWPSGRRRIELCYRSKSLTGDFEGKEILDSGLGTYGSGVAQGTMIEGPNGQWYALLFQDHGAVGRIPVLVPAKWENNWPVLGVNGTVPVTMDAPAGYTGTVLAKDDDFSYNTNKLDLLWQWNHNPDNTAWSVTEREGWLRLKNKTTASNILNAKNTLTMRTEGPACSSVIKLDTKGMKPGDHAGLSAFQFKYGNVGVRVADDGSKKIYMAVNGGSEIAQSSDNIIQETGLNGNEIYLKVDFKFNNVDANMNVGNNIDKANFYYSYDGSSWTKIGSELSMSYDLKLFTGYRSGIYSYGTKSTDGYADIDFFDYERSEWNKAEPLQPNEFGWWYNCGFEGGTDSWSGRGGNSVEQSGDEHYTQWGSKSLHVVDRTSAWMGASYALKPAIFSAGETYSFSAHVKQNSGENVKFMMKIEYTDANGDAAYDEVASVVAPSGTWAQLQNANYTIPEGASNVRIYVETEESLTDFYLDECIGAVAGTNIAGEGQPVVKEFLPGDADCDGIITSFDTAMARRCLMNKVDDEMSKKNADADQSGKLEINDIVLIQNYVLGRITEFPVNTPPVPVKPEYQYNANLQYKEAPGSYFTKPEKYGQLINETYNGINGTNKLNVYLPYGYDKSKKYNIFYLMHGGGENENVLINDQDKFYIHYMVEHMIQNGEIDPMIVVFPTFNKTEAADVWKEMKESIVPFVEGKYSTYAENTTPEGLRASRMHRAYGGFSMGGGSTWNVLINNIDYYGYYMPLSGHCWGGANPILNTLKTSGYGDSTYILAATGTKDIAYDNMVGLINTLKKDSVIKYTADFSKGNFYFLEAAEKTHWWGFVKHYVYDALPYFFHE